MSGSQPSVRDASTAQDVAAAPADPAAGKASSELVAWYAEGFSDRIGDRLQLFDNSGPGLELLRFNPALTANPAFEPALRASVQALDDFRHASFARVRKVTMLEEPGPQLALVSELVSGERLSKVLKAARLSGLRANSGAAIYLLRRLLPPVADLHARRIAHGLLTHDRIIVSQQGEFFITEHVLAGALGALGLTAADLWQRFGIATVRSGQADRRADVMQVALLALTLLVDRPLGPEDYPRGLHLLLREASARLLTGDGIVLQMWFRRALALEEPGFADASDAMAALDALLWDAPGQWNAGLLPGAKHEDAGGARAVPAVRQEPPPVPRAAARPGSVLFASAVPTSGAQPEAHTARAVRRLRWAAILLGILALGEGIGLAILLTRQPRVATETQAPRPTATVTKADPPAPKTQASKIGAAPAPTPAPALLPSPQATLPQPPQAAMADPPPEPLPAQSATAPAAVSRAPARTEIRPTPPRPKAPAANCWLAIDSPVEVRIFSDGRLIGSASRGRFPLTPGSHEIILVNEAQQFRSTQTVELTAGATVTITPTVSPP